MWTFLTSPGFYRFAGTAAIAVGIIDYATKRVQPTILTNGVLCFVIADVIELKRKREAEE